MLNKIQKYLLLNHPLLWNMRIVPMLGFTIVANILFFLIGYFSSSVDFTGNYYNYDDFINSGALYFSIGLVSVLTLIIWLIFYSKNNAFKSFYPKSSKSLYLEWVLIYAITFMSILPFFAVGVGSTLKICSYASEEETLKAVETLNMVKILIPSNKTDYYKEYPDEAYAINKTFSAPLDSAIMIAEKQSVYYENYPNFTQLSLLNCDDYNPIYLSSDYDVYRLKDFSTVKKWLVNQNKEAIEGLMDEFLKLHTKRHLKTNLTKDQWMKLVYNPSKYPVGDFNLISPYNINNEDSHYSYLYNYKPNGRGGYDKAEYYLQFNELKDGYERVLNAYKDPLLNPVALLIVLCVSGGFSLLVFSYRVTSGKAWLIASVSLGIFMFIDMLVSLMGGVIWYCIILLVLFVVQLIYILTKNSKGERKGRSDIYMNHLLWFIPAVPVILFFFVYTGTNAACYETAGITMSSIHDLETVGCTWYRFLDDHIEEFIFGNICLMFVSMWFFIRYVLLKWKSLPEE